MNSGDDGDNEKKEKRDLMSCVEGVSVPEERKLLREIRELGINNIDATTRLSNGWLAEEFAMMYVIGSRKKRIFNTKRSKLKRKARDVNNHQPMTGSCDYSDDGDDEGTTS